MSRFTQTVCTLILAIGAIAIGFHLLVLLGVIPYEIAWGGRLTSVSEMVVFELLSIAINLLFLFLVLQKANWIKRRWSEKKISLGLWIFFFLFLLNTIGNLFAVTAFERSLSMVTFVISVLVFWLNRSVKTVD
jgi:hypothetical protein